MLIEKPRLPVKDILLVGILPNFIKKMVYRLKGYKIGKGVSMSFGSVIRGEEVAIGDHTTIGFFTIIRGKKITIGDYVSIGSTSFLDTPYIEIGDGTKINEQVFVGGLQFPDSKFIVGRNCQIMQMTFINPAKSVTIGDDSGIGGHCLIFGHTSWLSIFEGYPVDFQPIEIGKSVSVAWGAFILPGTKIEEGAVIGAQSVASRTIPPRCIAVGFPARVVAKYPDFPIEVTEEKKVEFLKKIVSEMIASFQSSGLLCKGSENIFEFLLSKKRAFWHRNREFSLMVFYEALADDQTFPNLNRTSVVLSLKRIPGSLRGLFVSKNAMWIDIESKEQSRVTNDLGEEVLLILRRYGVRFFRV